jgi:hypothetical protein
VVDDGTRGPTTTAPGMTTGTPLDISGGIMSVLPPVTTTTSTTSSGRGDPRDFGFVAEDAAASRPGQTGPSDTFQDIYGYDPLNLTNDEIRNLSPTEFTDYLLATGNNDAFAELANKRPDLVLPPTPPTVIGTGQVPAGTPGAGSSANVLSPDEVQTLIEASPEARQVYQTLDLTPFVENINLGVSFGGEPADFRQVTKYRDPQGNVYSAAEAYNYIISGGSQPVTLPGGTTVVGPVDGTSYARPATDVEFRPFVPEASGGDGAMDISFMTVAEFEKLYGSGSSAGADSPTVVDDGTRGSSTTTSTSGSDTSGGILSVLPPVVTAPPAPTAGPDDGSRDPLPPAPPVVTPPETVVDDGSVDVEVPDVTPSPVVTPPVTVTPPPVVTPPETVVDDGSVDVEVPDVTPSPVVTPPVTVTPPPVVTPPDSC